MTKKNKKEKFEKIHIGEFIKEVVEKNKIEPTRIELYFKDSFENIIKVYEQEYLSTELLLKWSKFLKYDFFRIYSAHLMMYHAIYAKINNKKNVITTGINIRKNLYTPEIKQYIVNKVISNEMTISQVIERYGVGKTTIYRWLMKNEISN